MCKKITSLCLLVIPLLLTALHAQNPPPQPPDDWQLNVRNINANFYTVLQQADSFFINNPSAPGYKDYSRWVTFWESRVGTSQEPGSFKPAFNALSALFDLSPQDVCDHSSGFASKWTSIGPSQTPGTNFINQGWAGGVGVVSKVMFKAGDPTHNTIYLGTGSSGLWVTQNANSAPDQVTWVNLTDNSNLPTLGVTSFDINPSNTQEIYVASALTPHLPGFGYGLGIIKTTDGGATWQRSGLTYDPNQLDDNNKRITCLDVKIHPTMNHVVFAICGDVIWKSTDAGAIFTNVFELNDDNLPFRELVFHPSNPNTIYASSDDVASNNGGAELFVSYNGGDTWNTLLSAAAISTLGVTPVERMDIAVTPAAPDRIYLGCVVANARRILYWDGTNWHVITPTGLSGMDWNKNAFAVSPINAARIYWGGVRMFRCDNFSTTTAAFTDISVLEIGPQITNRLHADIRDLYIISESNSDWLLTGHDGGISISYNNGGTWTDINGQGLNITQFYGISVAQDYSAVVGGCQDLGLESINMAGGDNWANNSQTADGARCLIDLYNPSIFYGQLWGGNDNGSRNLARSTDTGLNWQPNIGPNIGNLGHKYRRPLEMHRNGLLYTGHEQVFRRNSNNNWEQLGVIPLANPNSGDDLCALGLSTQSEAVIYAAFHLPPGTTAGVLWKTSNADAANPQDVVWLDITPNSILPQAFSYDGGRATAIAVDPNAANRLWVSVDRFARNYKVVCSENGGQTWINVSTGLPDYPVNDIIFQEGTTGVLYAATDVGVYINTEANNINSVWKCINEGLPPSIVWDLDISYCKGKLVAGTFGRSSWEADIPIQPDVAKHISGTQTWDTERFLYTDLIIDPGVTLTIKSRVNIARGRSITVSPGSKLVVHGSQSPSQTNNNPQGITIYGGTGFTVEGNSLQPYAPAAMAGEAIGVFVIDAGEDDNSIYRNELKNLAYADLSNGVNGGKDFGLRYVCNQNTSNDFDFAVPYENNLAAGIATNQEGNIPTLSSGNMFTSIPLYEETHFYNQSLRPIRYFYYNSNSEIPVNYTINNVSPIISNTPNDCSSTLPSDNDDIADSEKNAIQSEIEALSGQLDSAKTALAAALDGGNTPQLLQQINAANHQNAAQLKADLLAVAPYLSEQALLALADRSDIFSHAEIQDIFIATPDESIDPRLLNYLQHKSDPMPSQLIQEIRDSVLSRFTARTDQIAGISTLSQARAANAYRLSHYLLTDTTGIDFNRLRDIWLEVNTISSAYARAESYLQQRDTAQAQAIFNQIPQLFNLEGEAYDEYNDLLRLNNIAVAAIRNGVDIKQAIQDSLAVVEDMITTGTGKAPIQAKAMFNYAGGIQLYPPVVLPDGGNVPLSRSDAGTALPAPMPKAASNKLVILPNPSSGQVTIQYTLDLETTRAAIDITDIEGKTIILLPVSDFKGEIQLTDSRLLPGIYAVRLLVDDFPVRIQKLVIIK